MLMLDKWLVDWEAEDPEEELMEGVESDIDWLVLVLDTVSETEESVTPE